MATGYNAAFSPAVRKSPIDNTDYELNDAYKPTGATTQPERSLTGGATASAPGAGANSVYGPKAPEETSSGLATSSHSNVVQDPYAPLMQHLSSASQNLESAYAAPHAGTARQIFGAILSRRNPGLGGLVSGETQRNRNIQQAQEDYGIAGSQMQAARAQQMNAIDIAAKQSTIDYQKKHGDYFDTMANAKENAPDKTDKMIDKGFDADGNATLLMQRPDNTTYTQKVPGMMNPATQKPDKPSDTDKAIGDYMQGHGLSDTPANRDKARDVLKTRDRVPKDPDLVDLGKQVKQAQLEKLKEPTADEQRRDDLSTNAEENLDQLQDILKRRPELFGRLAGRVTQLRGMVGTNDPDVAKLKALHEFYGMASVGAHAMRNAQHVSTAADAIMNGFTNGPDAMNGAISTARSSFNTFHQNAGRRRAAIDKATGGGGSSSAPPVDPKDPLGILQ